MKQKTAATINLFYPPPGYQMSECVKCKKVETCDATHYVKEGTVAPCDRFVELRPVGRPPLAEGKDVRCIHCGARRKTKSVRKRISCSQCGLPMPNPHFQRGQ